MSRPKTTKNANLQNLRQDLSGNVDAMLQFTDKGFCRVILSPESRASCNAAFIESFQLPSSPPLPPAECQINWSRVLLLCGLMLILRHKYFWLLLDFILRQSILKKDWPVANFQKCKCIFLLMTFVIQKQEIIDSLREGFCLYPFTAYFEFLVCFDFKIKIFGWFAKLSVSLAWWYSYFRKTYSGR